MLIFVYATYDLSVFGKLSLYGIRQKYDTVGLRASDEESLHVISASSGIVFLAKAFYNFKSP